VTAHLTINPGRNVWVLERTDADGADLPGVLRTAASVIHGWVEPATPASQRTIFDQVVGKTHDRAAEQRWIAGAARPLELTAVQAREFDEVPAMQVPASCKEYRHHTETGRELSIEAERPWFVLCAFDWRGSSAVIPWPRRAVDRMGFPVSTDERNQWLLLESAWLGLPCEPDPTFPAQERARFSRGTQEGLAAVGQVHLDANAASRKIATRVAQVAMLGLGGIALYRAIRHKPEQKRPTRARVGTRGST
jgi:hypothetical protein